jgi:hypothetical protein
MHLQERRMPFPQPRPTRYDAREGRVVRKKFEKVCQRNSFYSNRIRLTCHLTGRFLPKLAGEHLDGYTFERVCKGRALAGSITYSGGERMVCPYLDIGDRRCAETLRVENLDRAIQVCAGDFTTCPVFERIYASEGRSLVREVLRTFHLL